MCSGIPGVPGKCGTDGQGKKLDGRGKELSGRELGNPEYQHHRKKSWAERERSNQHEEPARTGRFPGQW